MDRKALSQRLEGLSTVFASGTPMHRDLKAMSEALSGMQEDKFASVLNPEYSADVEAAGFTTIGPKAERVPMAERPGAGSRTPTKTDLRSVGQIMQEVTKMDDHSQKSFWELASKVPFGQAWAEFKRRQFEKGYQDPGVGIEPGRPPAKAPKVTPMPGLKKYNASEEENTEEAPVAKDNEGLYWNREASNAVMSNLLRDVVGMDKSICCDTGRHLTPNEMPDGKHAGVPETPKTLTADQTPDQVDVLDSDIVAKSNETPLKKEAGDKNGPGVPDKDGKGPYGGTSACPMSGKGSKKKEKGAEKKEEGAKKKEAGLEELQKQKAEKAQQTAESLGEGVKKKEEEKAQKAEERAEQAEERAERAESESDKPAEKPAEKPEDKPSEEPKDKPADEPVLSSKKKKEAGEESVLNFEGIELTAPMEEVDIDDAEKQKLAKLFE